MLSYKKAKRLKKLGLDISEDKITGYWIKIKHICHGTESLDYIPKEKIKHKIMDWYIPTIDVENLLPFLPREILQQHITFKRKIERVVSYEESGIISTNGIENKYYGKDIWLVGYAWWVPYENSREMEIFYENESLEEAVADMLIWLIENGRIDRKVCSRANKQPVERRNNGSR